MAFCDSGIAGKPGIPVRFRFVFCPLLYYQQHGPLRFPVRFACFPVRFLARCFVFNNFSGSFLKKALFLSHIFGGVSNFSTHRAITRPNFVRPGHPVGGGTTSFRDDRSGMPVIKPALPWPPRRAPPNPADKTSTVAYGCQGFSAARACLLPHLPPGIIIHIPHRRTRLVRHHVRRPDGVRVRQPRVTPAHADVLPRHPLSGTACYGVPFA